MLARHAGRSRGRLESRATNEQVDVETGPAVGWRTRETSVQARSQPLEQLGAASPEAGGEDKPRRNGYGVRGYPAPASCSGTPGKWHRMAQGIRFLPTRRPGLSSNLLVLPGTGWMEDSERQRKPACLEWRPG